MKKLFSILSAFVICLFVFGCGESEINTILVDISDIDSEDVVESDITENVEITTRINTLDDNETDDVIENIVDDTNDNEVIDETDDEIIEVVEIPEHELSEPIAIPDTDTTIQVAIYEITIGEFCTFFPEEKEVLSHIVDMLIFHGGLGHRFGPIEDFPAYVTYSQAEAYAEKVGMRLPSEKEWIHAMKGDGNIGRSNVRRRQPWGFNNNKTLKPCNNDDSIANGYGIHEMLGNASEWVNDVIHSTNTGKTYQMKMPQSYGNLEEWPEATAKLAQAWPAFDGVTEPIAGLRLVKDVE